MTKNLLQRYSGSSLESHVYQFTQYPQSLFTTQRLSSARTLTTQNIITVPPNGKSNFTTGQWRALNLKLDPTGGYGTQDEGANLTFGFANEGNGSFSAACGFTLGIPPLHATHVNTVSRSIAYGFIINPFPDNPGLYIVHENNLIQRSGTPFASLSIGIKDGVVTYKSGDLTLLTFPMANTSMVLYVVGCLGFDKNKITDLSLSGGNSALLTAPDFTKEIYIPCKGLTISAHNSISQQNPIGVIKADSAGANQVLVDDLTSIQIKGTTNKSFTIFYPNGHTEVISPNDSNPFITIGGTNQVSSFSPFTIKIQFESLADLQGLRVINPLISTELSLNRSLPSLTNLKELEVRSAFSSGGNGIPSFNVFYPTIGENLPLPNPANGLSSLLEKAHIEGSFELKEHDLSRQQALTHLYLSTHITSATFPKICAARNLTYFEIENSTNTSISNLDWFLSNFRNVFKGVQLSPNTHGVRMTNSSNGTQGALSQTNTVALAIAQQSYMLMYNKTAVDRGNHQLLFGNALAFGSGINFTNSGATRTGVSVTENSVTYTAFVRDRLFHGFIDGNIVFSVYHTVPDPSVGDLVCIRTSGANSLDPLNHQLRKIKTFSWEEPEVSVTATSTNSTPSLTKTIQAKYKKITITTEQIKEPETISNLTVTNNNSFQANTFRVTGVGNNWDSSIEIGDSVWAGSSSPTALSNLSHQPAIVIRKETNDGVRSLIVLQSVGSNQITTTTATLTFRWEWGLQNPNFSPNLNTYPTEDLDSDSVIESNSGLMTNVFTDGRAAFAFLVAD